MKKNILTSIILTICLQSTIFTKSNSNLVMINDNGLKIYQTDYNKMLSMGVTDKEIKSLTKNELLEYSKMNIVSISKFSNKNDKIKKANIDGNSSSSKNNRKIETYVTWFNIENVASSYYYVKVNVDWLVTPADRLTDIIGVYFGNENQMQYVNTNSGQKMKFSSKLFYDEYYYYDYKSSISSPKHEEYTKSHTITKDSYSTDIDSFSYGIGQHFLLKYTLPADRYVETKPDPDYGNQESLLKQQYSNFSFTLGAYFAPVYSTVVRSSFSGYYSHQKSGRSINFSDLELSTSAPFIKINVPWYQFINKPTIDEVITSTTFVSK